MTIKDETDSDMLAFSQFASCLSFLIVLHTDKAHIVEFLPNLSTDGLDKSIELKKLTRRNFIRHDLKPVDWKTCRRFTKTVHINFWNL